VLLAHRDKREEEVNHALLSTEIPKRE